MGFWKQSGMVSHIRLEATTLASLSWEELTLTDGATCWPRSRLELGRGVGAGAVEPGHKAPSVPEISHSAASVVLSEGKNRPSL